MAATAKEHFKLVSIPQIPPKKHNLHNLTHYLLQQQNPGSAQSSDPGANNRKSYLYPLLGGDYHQSQGVRLGHLEGKAGTAEAPREKTQVDPMGLWMTSNRPGGQPGSATGVLSGPAAFLYEGAQVLGLQQPNSKVAFMMPPVIRGNITDQSTNANLNQKEL